MPRKIRIGRHYKNRERNKRASNLTACLLIVSLPLFAFTNNPASSVQNLGRRLEESQVLINGWALKICEEMLTVYKLDTSHRSAPVVQYSILIFASFTWKIHIYGQEVPVSICRLIADIPTALTTVVAVTTVVNILNRSYVCIGNSDMKFQELRCS